MTWRFPGSWPGSPSPYPKRWHCAAHGRNGVLLSRPVCAAQCCATSESHSRSRRHPPTENLRLLDPMPARVVGADCAGSVAMRKARRPPCSQATAHAAELDPYPRCRHARYIETGVTYHIISRTHGSLSLPRPDDRGRSRRIVPGANRPPAKDRPTNVHARQTRRGVMIWRLVCNTLEMNRPRTWRPLE
jgi:hypothetical protein